MDHDLERKRHFLINAAYYTLIIAILYVSFRYVIYAVTPFVIAAVITLAETPFTSSFLNCLSTGE